MILEYGLMILFFLWVKTMLIVVFISLLEGGFGLKLNGKRLIGIVELSAILSLIITTLITS